jgi:hypothetical protein
VKARILGKPILDFHVALVGLSLLDGFLVLWKHRIAWLHVPSVIWSSLVNISSWVCPLTPLENMHRHLAGQAGYEGGFIQHYIAPLVSPCGMPRRQEGADNRIIGFSVLGWNAFVYGLVVASKSISLPRRAGQEGGSSHAHLHLLAALTEQGLCCTQHVSGCTVETPVR